MSERIVPLNLGFCPEAAVSGAVLLQTEYSTYLLFNAMRREAERLVDAGRAVIEFEGCWVTQFGYPNDEPRSAVPRYRGLSYDCYEVLESQWIAELIRLNRLKFPSTQDSGQRHFMFLFHDSSFECVATDLKADLTNELFSDIWARLGARVAAE